MNKISEITRRDIFDVIKEGFDEEVFIFDMNKPYSEPKTKLEHYYMPYYGRLTELEFVGRLYDLKELPSKDTRYHNAYDDIYCHTISFDDWPKFWIFNDNRFQLNVCCDDEPLLRYVCEMLHPAVRREDSPWKDYLNTFNKLLEPDGYELYIENIISGRDVYGFREIDSVEISRNGNTKEIFPLKLIGEGSYATVYKYKDQFYNKTFALKRAKKGLDSKELERFKNEYEYMSKVRSPYVLEVYSYNENKKEYIMEYMDSTLDDYIEKNNIILNMQQRKHIVEQLIQGFADLHLKHLLHRDISYNNVLVKKYETSIVVKISDFGLAKFSYSELTSNDSDIKGYLNDPSLRSRGFGSYDFLDEIYSLTSLLTFVITGKKNFQSIKEQCAQNFWKGGICSDRSKRYQTLSELQQAAIKCIDELQSLDNRCDGQLFP